MPSSLKGAPSHLPSSQPPTSHPHPPLSCPHTRDSSGSIDFSFIFLAALRSGILVPQPGTEPRSLQQRVSPSLWATRNSKHLPFVTSTLFHPLSSGLAHASPIFLRRILNFFVSQFEVLSSLGTATHVPHLHEHDPLHADTYISHLCGSWRCLHTQSSCQHTHVCTQMQQASS